MPKFLRKEAFKLAWSAPMRDLATRFGLSDVGLKKALMRLDIPTPPQGYWNKVKAGKTVAQPRLPPRDPGMPWEVELGPAAPYWQSVSPAKLLEEPEPSEPRFEEELTTVEARAVAAIGRVAVKTLNAPHPAVRKLMAKDEERRQKQQASTWGSDFYAPYFDSAFERRRLKVLNSVLLSVGRFGRGAECRAPKAREIWMTIGFQSLQIWLDHPDARANRHGEWSTRPGKADRLKLVIGSDWTSKTAESWQDEPDNPLEQQLAEIAVRIVIAAEKNLRDSALAQYRWQLERREKARLELAESQRKALEAERRRKEEELAEARRRLLACAADHRAAEDIRSFVAAAERQASKEGASHEGLKEWTAWALGVADGLDPLQRIADILEFPPKPSASR